MTFPEFDINNIKLIAKTLSEWLNELPEDTYLRVFHTESDGTKTTWLEDQTNNTIYCVSESKGK